MRATVHALVLVLLAALLATFAPPAAALSTGQMEKIGKLVGFDGDQMQSLKFYLAHPDCANTVISYTEAGDYSLIALIAGLKATKNGIAGLPQISQQQCRAANPVQKLFRLLKNDAMDKILTKEYADLARTLLGAQIAAGESQVSAQVAAIPYVGTILTHWDCGCDFAFETTYAAEGAASQATRDVVTLAKAAKSGDVALVEYLITRYGAALGCKIGEEMVGTSKLPLVSGIIHSACAGAVGAVLGWVNDSTSTILQMVGLTGGHHMPVETYYASFMKPASMKPNYKDVGVGLKKDCIAYFEPTEMAADTTEKVCSELYTRLLVDGDTYVQAIQAEAELGNSYWPNVMMPVATGSAMVIDGEAVARSLKSNEACIAYFRGKYPRFNPEKRCQHFALNLMASSRENAQKAILTKTRAALEPFCTQSTRNALTCATGPAYASCRKALPALCVNSTMKNGRGFPCCEAGKADAVTTSNMGGAKNVAAFAGDYCSASKDDPYKVECATQVAYDGARDAAAKFNDFIPDCAKTQKNAAGQHDKVCLALVPAMLEQVPGITQVKTLAAAVNKELGYASCLLQAKFVGPAQARSDDLRVVTCSAAGGAACSKSLPGACKKGPLGLVEKACCQVDPFAADLKAYDVKQRSPDLLAIVKQAQGSLAPKCQASKTAGAPAADDFHFACDTTAALAQCREKIAGVNRTGACSTVGDSKQFSPSAYDSFAMQPCCSLKTAHTGTLGPATPGPATAAGVPGTTALPPGLTSGPASGPTPLGPTKPGPAAAIPFTPAKTPAATSIGTKAATPAGLGAPSSLGNPGASAGMKPATGGSLLAPAGGPLKPLVDAGCRATGGDPLAFTCPPSGMGRCETFRSDHKVKSCTQK